MFVICLIFTACFAGTIDPSVDDQKYIDYGSEFVHVGQIVGVSVDDRPYFASGIAYKDNIILTAAHVVDQAKDGFFKLNDKIFSIKEFIKHEEFKSEKFGNYDIAIGILSEPIGLKWYPELYENNDEVGKVCSIAGCGMTGTFSIGVTKIDKHKRAGSNIIDKIDRDLLICTPGGPKKTSLEFIIAEGDSGGGLFIDNKIAGINSCVITSPGQKRSTYGTESGHTRISKYNLWIKENINNYEKKKTNK